MTDSVESLLHLVLAGPQNFHARPQWFSLHVRRWLSTPEGCAALLRGCRELRAPIAPASWLRRMIREGAPRKPLEEYPDAHLAWAFEDPAHLLTVCVRIHPEHRETFIDAAAAA